MRVQHRNRQERWQGTLPEKAMIAVWILGFVLGVGLLIGGLWLFLFVTRTAVLSIVAGVICLLNWLYSLQTGMAEFSFRPEGVWVKYPLEKRRFYPWEEFQQVCVCYYSRATEMNGYPLICLVRNGEKKDHFGRWKTGSVLHYRNLLCLDYSEDQLQKIRECCPYDVPDLRGKGNYKL